MAERDAGEEPDSQAPAHENIDDLPIVEAPPLSPAGNATSAPLDRPERAAAIAPLRLKLKPRHKRQMLTLAAVTLAAAFGALMGSLAGSWGPPNHDVADLQERQAMQRSIQHLSRQVTLLKAELHKANAATPRFTGSIARAGETAAVPLPRPAPHLSAVASRPAIVPDWHIRDVRGGYVYVETRGEIYQVVPGAPLPGLGPVQSITRRKGHWVVVTPRGNIVSARDRRFFD